MIGAVVVLYNPTKEEILNINTYIYSIKHLVIIDNSDNNSIGLIDKYVERKDNIIYEYQGCNIGLAKAFNIGVSILRHLGYQWALLMDSDSKFKNEIIQIYLKAIKTHGEDVAVFSPVHSFSRSNKTTYTGYRKIQWAMTSGCIYNCDIFFKLNGFLEELFVDGLDMDYCFKANANGYQVIECGEVCILHNPAITKSFLGIKYGFASPDRYFMQARQLVWCIKKYQVSQAIYIYIYKWLKVLFLFPNKRKYITAMLNGSLEGKRLYNERK